MLHKAIIMVISGTSMSIIHMNIYYIGYTKWSGKEKRRVTKLQESKAIVSLINPDST